MGIFTVNSPKQSRDFVIGLVVIIWLSYALITQSFLFAIGPIFGVTPNELHSVSGSGAGSLLPDNFMATALLIGYQFVCGVGLMVAMALSGIGKVLWAVVVAIWSKATKVTAESEAESGKFTEILAEIIKQQKTLDDRLRALEPPVVPEPTTEEQLADALKRLAAIEDAKPKTTAKTRSTGQ